MFCNLMDTKILIFSAPSGAGKTTIVHNLLDDEKFKLKFSVSACSRKIRGAELDGKDYYFLSAEEFRSKIKNNEFLEWEEVYKDNYYGSLKSEVERIRQQGYNVIFDVDVKGGLNIKKYFKDDALAIFVMPPSVEELEKRLLKRSTDEPDAIKTRIEKSKLEMEFADKFDVIVVNDNLENAIQEVRDLVSEFLNL